MINAPTSDTNEQAGRGAAFRQAASEGDIAQLEKLFSPSLLNEAGKTSGKTALHRAAMSGKIHVVRWLLGRGATKEVIDAKGKSPLFLALVYNHMDVANDLTAEPKKASYRLPPLIFLASEVAGFQTQAILANLPYLQSLGYRAFVHDFSHNIPLDELLHYVTDMSRCKTPGWENHECKRRIFEALKKSPWLTPYGTASAFMPTLHHMIPTSETLLRDELHLGKKIVTLAEQYDGGVICFLGFGEHPTLLASLNTLLKEKTKQFIFYSEFSLAALMQNLNIATFYNGNCNLHFLKRENLETSFKNPILKHFSYDERERYYDKSVSSSAVLTKLKSVFSDFEELHNALEPCFDAVLPVRDIADFQQKAALFSAENIKPLFCLSKSFSDSSQAGKLSLTLENVESPENRRKILEGRFN